MRKKKRGFDLIEEYKKGWNYIAESKIFIYWIIGIFSFFALVGFIFPVPESMYNEIINLIKEILEKTKDMSTTELISFIISNNIQTTFFSLLFGGIFGIYPVISAVANGYLLGFVSSMSAGLEGFSSLWRIFPHGIFELPAVFISLGLGLRIGSFIFQKKKLKSFVYYLTNSLKVFLLIIVPLLIVAGIIEGILISFTG